MKIFYKIKSSSFIREFYLLGIRIFSYHKYSRFADHVKIMPDSFVDDKTDIGNYTYIGHNVHITKAHIGRYCSIADNVTIGAGEHSLHSVSTSSYVSPENNYDTLTKLPLVIKNDVWIGVDSIIRRGVTIGNGAVVGANSFVNHDVPDFAIVAGNPARIIGYRFEPEKASAITKSQWWNFDLAEARTIVAKL